MRIVESVGSTRSLDGIVTVTSKALLLSPLVKTFPSKFMDLRKYKSFTKTVNTGLGCYSVDMVKLDLFVNLDLLLSDSYSLHLKIDQLQGNFSISGTRIPTKQAF